MPTTNLLLVCTASEAKSSLNASTITTALWIFYNVGQKLCTLLLTLMYATLFIAYLEVIHCHEENARSHLRTAGVCC